MIRTITLILLLCAINTDPLFCADDARSIMQNHFNLKSSDSSIMNISLMLIDSSGRKLSRSFTKKCRSTKSGDYNYIEVTAPADIAGVRLLSIPSKGSDEQRLFLPALGKSRLIAGSGSSGKGGRFLGSDICYYDIEAKKIDDAKYTYIKQETIDGKLFHIIDAVSFSSDCPYKNSRFWVSDNQWLIYKTECFEKKTGNLIKEMKVRSFKEIKGVQFINEMIITDHKRNHTTLYKLHSAYVNPTLDEAIFTVRYLER